MVELMVEWCRLRSCLVLAALACILRPTNILIWICVAFYSLFRPATNGYLVPFRWADVLVWINILSFAPLPAPQRERRILFREITLCGYYHAFWAKYMYHVNTIIGSAFSLSQLLLTASITSNGLFLSYVLFTSTLYGPLPCFMVVTTGTTTFLKATLFSSPPTFHLPQLAFTVQLSIIAHHLLERHCQVSQQLLLTNLPQPHFLLR